MGIALINAYREIDMDLILPTNRSEMEKLLNQIAEGQEDYEMVRDKILDFYREKFIYFMGNFYKVEHYFKGGVFFLYFLSLKHKKTMLIVSNLWF